MKVPVSINCQTLLIILGGPSARRRHATWHWVPGPASIQSFSSSSSLPLVDSSSLFHVLPPAHFTPLFTVLEITHVVTPLVSGRQDVSAAKQCGKPSSLEKYTVRILSFSRIARYLGGPRRRAADKGLLYTWIRRGVWAGRTPATPEERREEEESGLMVLGRGEMGLLAGLLDGRVVESRARRLEEKKIARLKGQR